MGCVWVGAWKSIWLYLVFKSNFLYWINFWAWKNYLTTLPSPIFSSVKWVNESRSGDDIKSLAECLAPLFSSQYFEAFWKLKAVVAVVWSFTFSEHWLETLRGKKTPQCLQWLCFFGVHLIINSAWVLHTALPLFFSCQDCYNVLKILIILFTLYTGLEKQISLLCLLEGRVPLCVCVCVCVCRAHCPLGS